MVYQDSNLKHHAKRWVKQTNTTHDLDRMLAIMGRYSIYTYDYFKLLSNGDVLVASRRLVCIFDGHTCAKKQHIDLNNSLLNDKYRVQIKEIPGGDIIANLDDYDFLPKANLEPTPCLGWPNYYRLTQYNRLQVWRFGILGANHQAQRAPVAVAATAVTAVATNPNLVESRPTSRR